MLGVAAMAERERRHIPVMLDEALAGLAVRPDGRYLDGTFGRGGHAAAILGCLGPHGRLLLMDRDPAAIAVARDTLGADPRVAIRHGNFADLADWSETAAGLDGVLLDLGMSSPQLDEAARGFSFMTDAPLDMRMDPGAGESAAEFLAHADAEAIADVLWRYGDERMSRRIARAIVARRENAPLARTGELAELLVRTLGRREPGKHPATRTFQALRIHVNGDQSALQRRLVAAVSVLKPGGRLAVISFHSLEDRAVKQFIRGPQPERVRRGLPQAAVAAPPLVAVGRKQFPGDAETAANPRARSAVLRVAGKPA